MHISWSWATCWCKFHGEIIALDRSALTNNLTNSMDSLVPSFPFYFCTLVQKSIPFISVSFRCRQTMTLVKCQLFLAFYSIVTCPIDVFRDQQKAKHVLIRTTIFRWVLCVGRSSAIFILALILIIFSSILVRMVLYWFISLFKLSKASVHQPRISFLNNTWFKSIAAEPV